MKIGKVYKSVCNWVYNLGGDRWCHVVCGLIIAFIVAVVSHHITGEAKVSGVGVGVIFAFIAGFVKETLDAISAPTYEEQSGRWDVKDFLATVAGGILGGLLFII